MYFSPSAKPNQLEIDQDLTAYDGMARKMYNVHEMPKSNHPIIIEGVANSLMFGQNDKR